MKRNEKDEKIRRFFLAESGELTEAEQAEHQRLMDTDPELAAYAEDVSTLVRTARESTRCDGPSAKVLENIREHAVSRKRVLFPAPAWGLAAAAAAVAVVCTLAVLFRPPAAGPYATVDDPQDGARTVSALIVMLSEDSDSLEDPSVSGGVNDLEWSTEEPEAVRALAAQLLRLEGLDPQPFDVADSYYDDLPPDLSHRRESSTAGRTSGSA